MINNNMNGLVFEGISGSGKTTILKCLLKNNTYINRKALSTIVYTEHQTQRILEKKDRENILKIEDNLNLLWDIINTLKRLDKRLNERDWNGKSYEESKISYIFERFHLTHVCHYPHITWDMVKPIDTKLSLLGCKICLFTVNEDMLYKRLFRRKESCWLEYLKRYGDTEKEIIKNFMIQQEKFINLCKISSIPSMIIDTSYQEEKYIVDKIIDFWGI
ncbi:hypothetical protein [Defluviitalea phaphyphila]|uniref:hypothetical protein n=1 Tax=Defluviitalea phaphyphila TaxID=1473580 RepID=UPI00072FCD6D|nr:hypothetical protein [Defluviitalea phaphyphila]